MKQPENQPPFDFPFPTPQEDRLREYLTAVLFRLEPGNAEPLESLKAALTPAETADDWTGQFRAGSFALAVTPNRAEEGVLTPNLLAVWKYLDSRNRCNRALAYDEFGEVQTEGINLAVLEWGFENALNAAGLSGVPLLEMRTDELTIQLTKAEKEDKPE